VRVNGISGKGIKASHLNEDFLDFLDFLQQVDPDNKNFVIEIHESLMEKGCKIKISSTKAYPFQVAYTMPNSRKGILNFWLRKKGLKVRVTIVDENKHADLLNRLPEVMKSQIEKKNPCREINGQGKCYDNCTGAFDFHIRGTHYQRCLYDCFQFDVDTESIPFFTELLEQEFKARRAKSVTNSDDEGVVNGH